MKRRARDPETVHGLDGAVLRGDAARPCDRQTLNMAFVHFPTCPNAADGSIADSRRAIAASCWAATAGITTSGQPCSAASTTISRTSLSRHADGERLWHVRALDHLRKPRWKESARIEPLRHVRCILQIDAGRSRQPQWLRSSKATSAITRERYPCSRRPATERSVTLPWGPRLLRDRLAIGSDDDGLLRRRSHRS